jgi:Cu+-exporting ATPase
MMLERSALPVDIAPRPRPAGRRLQCWCAALSGVVLLAMAEPPRPSPDGVGDVLTLLAVVGLLLWCGGDIWWSAWRRLAYGQIGPELLILVSATAALFHVLALMVWPAGTLPEVEANLLGYPLLLVALYWAGRQFRQDLQGSAGRVVRRLRALRPDRVVLVTAGGDRTAPVSEVISGDCVRVATGRRVPVDGRLLGQSAWLDESLLTGRITPVSRGRGDVVVAGALNRGPEIVIQATRVGAETSLSRLIGNIHQAGREHGGDRRLQGRICHLVLWLALFLALIAALLQHALGAPARIQLGALLGVLLLTCPPAFTLASTASMRMALVRAGEYGARVRRSAALRAAQDLSIMVFDSQGALSAGRPEVVAVEPADGVAVRDLFRFAASLAAQVEGDGRAAIVHAAAERDIDVLPVQGHRMVRDAGSEGQVDGHEVLLGPAACLAARGVPNPLSVRGAELQDEGSIPLYLAVDGRVAGLIALGDPPRPDAAAAVARLHRYGIRTVLISGDDVRVARALAREVGIDEVVAGLSPDARAAHIRQLQRGGVRVGMVGNGVNDAAAMVQADIAFALASGTDIAVESADVMLLGDDLHGVVNSISLARAMRGNIRQNMAISIIYNVGAMAVASGMFLPLLGWSPGSALLLCITGLSAAMVVANASRLRFQDIPDAVD